MSIRMIARELYHLQQEVGRLEKEIEAASIWEQERLKDQLRKAVAERDRMRKILDARKDSSNRNA